LLVFVLIIIPTMDGMEIDKESISSTPLLGKTSENNLKRSFSNLSDSEDPTLKVFKPSEDYLNDEPPDAPTSRSLSTIFSYLDTEKDKLKKGVRAKKTSDREIAVDDFLSSLKKFLFNSWKSNTNDITINDIKTIINDTLDQKFKHSYAQAVSKSQFDNKPTEANPSTPNYTTSQPTPQPKTPSNKHTNPTTKPPITTQFHVAISDPSSNHPSTKILEDIQKNIFPSKLGIRIMSSICKTPYKLIIHLENRKHEQILFTELENLVSREIIPQNLKLTCSFPILRKIAILNVPDQDSNEDILNSIKKLNPSTSIDSTKIIARIKKSSSSTLLLTTSSLELFNNTINSNFIHTEWSRLKVEEGRYARLCHNCGSFRHSDKHCTAKTTCLRCTGSHKTANCPKDTPNKCINCAKLGAQNDNHQAISKICPTFVKFDSIIKQSIHYD
jgi:hypothetical protein